MQKQKAKNRVRGFERLESRCLLSSVWVQSGTLTLTSSDSLAAGSALYVGAGGTLLFDPTAAPVGAPTGAVIADGAQVYTTGSPLGPTTYLNGSIVQDTSTVNGSPFTTLNQYLGNSSTQVTPATIPDPPPAPADQNSYSGGTISVASGVATIAAGSWAGIPQGDYSTTGLTLTIPPQAVVYNTGTVDVDNGTVTLSGGSWANVPQNNVTLVLTEGGTSLCISGIVADCRGLHDSPCFKRTNPARNHRRLLAQQHGCGLHPLLGHRAGRNVSGQFAGPVRRDVYAV